MIFCVYICMGNAFLKLEFRSYNEELLLKNVHYKSNFINMN